MYYLNKNNKIILFSENLSILKNTIKFLPEFSEEDIQETTREIITLNNESVFRDEHEEEYAAQQQTEQEIANLADIDSQLKEIKDNFATAELLNDDEWKAELKTQYQELING